MEYYLQKTYYKTASLISNSCKAIALLAGHTAEVSVLAYDYGRNLVSPLPSPLPAGSVAVVVLRDRDEHEELM